MTAEKIRRREGDPPIVRRRQRYGDGSIFRDIRMQLVKTKTPEGRARGRLLGLLNTIGVDPQIVASGVHFAFVQLMQDLIIESEPDDDIATIFEPLLSLVGEQMAIASRDASQEAIDQANAEKANDVLNAWLSLPESFRAPRVGVSAIAALFQSAESDITMGADTIRKHLKVALSTLKAE